MQATVSIALFGCLIIVIVLFTTLRPHRAAIASVLGGYLFLPKTQWTIASGVPDWSYDASISLSTLAGAIAFAPDRILSFRPSRLDAIIGVGFVCWGLSSSSAGFGIKQAVPDWSFYLNWAFVPYFLVRCFMTKPDELRVLAMGILLGEALYLCTRMFGTYIPIREYATRVAEVVYPERAFSLQVRFNHEGVLASESRERLLLGHGGWGEFRDIDAAVPEEATGPVSTITAGFCIIVFGQRLLVGLVTVFGWMLVPATLAIWIVSRREVLDSLAYLVIGFGLWSVLYASDLLLNGSVRKVQGFVAGSLASFVAWYRAHAPCRLVAGSLRGLEPKQTRRVIASQHSAPPDWPGDEQMTAIRRMSVLVRKCSIAGCCRAFTRSCA